MPVTRATVSKKQDKKNIPKNKRTNNSNDNKVNKDTSSYSKDMETEETPVNTKKNKR